MGGHRNQRRLATTVEKSTLFLLLFALLLPINNAFQPYHPIERILFPIQSELNAPILHHGSMRQRRGIRLSQSAEDKNNEIVPFSRLMIAAPFLSVIFPVLVNVARSFPSGSTEQLGFVVALIVSNRAYLYLMSTLIVALAAFRGSKDNPKLGQRVVDLTEELLYSPPFEKESPPFENERKFSFEENPEQSLPKPKDKFQRPTSIQNLSGGLGESLDEISSDTQAILLPLIVSLLLAASVYCLQLFNTESTVPTAGTENITALMSEYLPQLSKLWNAFLLTLFAKSEVRRLGFELKLNFENEWLPWLIAVGITSIAYAGIWPAQNFINMALAGLVARAIQIPTFPSIVAAMTFLTFYDAASVFLVKPAFAADDLILVGKDAATASSAMGAVAMNKLLSADFQPGLLVTKVKSSLGGALGLGDAVFPSILAIFSKRYDDARSSDNKRLLSIFGASLVGYLIGCLACEFLPFLSTSGAPALLLISPSMLLVVLGTAGIQGELQEFWSFNPVDKDLD